MELGTQRQNEIDKKRFHFKNISTRVFHERRNIAASFAKYLAFEN